MRQIVTDNGSQMKEKQSQQDILYFMKIKLVKKVCRTQVNSFEKEENNKYEIDNNQGEEIFKNCANEENYNKTKLRRQIIQN